MKKRDIPFCFWERCITTRINYVSILTCPPYDVKCFLQFHHFNQFPNFFHFDIMQNYQQPTLFQNIYGTGMGFSRVYPPFFAFLSKNGIRKSLRPQPENTKPPFVSPPGTHYTNGMRFFVVSLCNITTISEAFLQVQTQKRHDTEIFMPVPAYCTYCTSCTFLPARSFLPPVLPSPLPVLPPSGEWAAGCQSPAVFFSIIILYIPSCSRRNESTGCRRP